MDALLVELGQERELNHQISGKSVRGFNDECVDAMLHHVVQHLGQDRSVGICSRPGLLEGSGDVQLPCLAESLDGLGLALEAVAREIGHS